MIVNILFLFIIIHRCGLKHQYELKTRRNKFNTMKNTWKIYMLAFISFIVGTSEFVIAGILDKVAASANISVSAAGQLITVFSIAYAFGPPIIMMALAKWDRRKLLILALSILVLGSFMTVTLSGFIFLIASRVVLALGTGVFVITAITVAPKLAPEGRQAGAVATIATGFSAALVIGVPIGRVLSTAYDWKTIFWGIGIICLLAIFAVARTIPVTEGDAPVPLGKQLTLLKKPNILMSLGMTLFVFISYSVVQTFMTPFLSSIMKMGDGEISAALFGLGIASLIGSKLGGFLADRIGTARTLFGSNVFQVLALILLSIISGSLIGSITLLIIWMIAAWSFGSVQNFNVVSLAPEASGIMASLNSSFTQLGIAAGAGIGGIAAGSSSMLAITWVGAASVTIAVLIAAILFSPARMFEKNIMTK
ncbi:MFS transporter [Neobacillus sp. 3P2-tot-E-2]|uniref:MFS transporter n=1 Tax=Neobacillus sp. 3P2-tot-E-2 TaxID=3132212 RepID=UPI0039A0A3DD